MYVWGVAFLTAKFLDLRFGLILRIDVSGVERGDRLLKVLKVLVLDEILRAKPRVADQNEEDYQLQELEKCLLQLDFLVLAKTEVSRSRVMGSVLTHPHRKLMRFTERQKKGRGLGRGA